MFGLSEKERLEKEADMLSAAAVGGVQLLADFIDTFGDANTCPEDHQLIAMIEGLVLISSAVQFSYTLPMNKKFKEEQIFPLFHRKAVENLIYPLRGIADVHTVTKNYHECFQKRYYKEYMGHLTRIAGSDKQSVFVLLMLFELYSKWTINPTERSPDSAATESFMMLIFSVWRVVRTNMTFA